VVAAWSEGLAGGGFDGVAFHFRVGNGGVGYYNCPNARLGAGARPPDPCSSSMRLKRAPLTTSTLQRTDPASDGRILETCLVTLPPSGGTDGYPNPAMTC